MSHKSKTVKEIREKNMVARVHAAIFFSWFIYSLARRNKQNRDYSKSKVVFTKYGDFLNIFSLLK